MILTQILIDNAKKFPNAPALTMKMGFRTVSLTYGEVYDVSRQIALLLKKEGVGPQDKVLFLAPNSPYWICCFWACLLRGAIAVPLNVQSTPEMVEKIANQVEAKLFFAHRFYRHEPPRGVKKYEMDLIKSELDPYDPAQFTSEDIFKATEDDLAEILYNSGTTGDPKGVMLTHKNLCANIKSVSQMTLLKMAQERMLSILPLSHIFEQAGGFFLAQYYAVHVIYAHSPSVIGDLLKEYRITKMLAVPEFLKILMSRIESAAEERGKKSLFDKLINFSLKMSNKFLSRLLFRSVHKKIGGKLDIIVSGGAPLDQKLERKWNALGIYLLQGYGLTETSPVVTSNTEKEHRFASVGKVAPGVQVRISDEGEIQVKGPNVFQGYFNDAEKTKAVFTPDGFFKTGDMGEFDEDGFLFLKGRKKYMIVGPGGQNVFPEDIEKELNLLPGVVDSCVVGLETESGMVQIHAVFLFDEVKVDPNALIEKANEKLASYQQVTAYSVWPEDDFPRSATKKVKKELVITFLKEQEGGNAVVPDGKGPLIHLLASVSGVTSDKITDQTKLVAQLAIDSLMRIELVARLEDKFGLLIDETEITMETTVADLEKMIKEKKPVKGLPPLSRWPRSWWASGLRIVFQNFLFLIMRTFVKIRIEGLENLQGLELPVVLMPNHTSYLDAFVLVKSLPAAVKKRLAFAAANDVLYDYYRHLAVLGELIFNAFPFPRKEHENIKLGLDYMGRLLDKNYSIIVYPEGKISLDGKLQPLKRGSGLIAVEMDVYVVPVIIEGSHKIIPYAKMFPRMRGTVHVRFGKPIKFKPTDSYITATEEIEKVMQDLATR